MNICIVGLGGMGRLYWRELERLPDTRVTCVVSGTMTREDAWNRGAAVYRSISEMVASSKPDVCCVCTPSFLHFEQIESLLLAGIHVISEKPLTLDAKQAAFLYALAQKNGVQLFAAQVVRFAYPSRMLKDWVCQNTFGRVLDASFSRLSTNPFRDGNGWIFDLEKSGLIPYDLHIHDLDLIVSLFGKPERAGYLSCGSGEKPYPEHCRFFYQYSGFQVFAEAAWFDAVMPFTVQWRVSFERAVAVCCGEEITLYRPGAQACLFAPPLCENKETGINVPPSDMYHDELTHFLRCIRENRPSDIVKTDEVLTTLEILDEMMRSETILHINSNQ